MRINIQGDIFHKGVGANKMNRIFDTMLNVNIQAFVKIII